MYLAPCKARISDDFGDHVARNSKEPGTDYACAYGTTLVAAGSGRVVVADNSPAGADGRRVSIDLDDGRRVSYIHLSSVRVKYGQRIARGGVIGKSGASGFGKNWHYGPHVHVSLWSRPGLSMGATINFERYVGDDWIPPFPLKRGYYFGPKNPVWNRRSVSGYYSHRTDLKRWQTQMRARGWQIKADGLYGAETRAVTLAFQKQKGLKADGLIGPDTWHAAWTLPVT